MFPSKNNKTRVCGKLSNLANIVLLTTKKASFCDSVSSETSCNFSFEFDPGFTLSGSIVEHPEFGSSGVSCNVSFSLQVSCLNNCDGEMLPQ